MCLIDWGLLANWITAIAALGALIVAVIALNTWRTQARASVVHEVEAAAWTLRYAFYGARAPLIQGWEFPQAYWEAARNRDRTNIEEADGFWHVYQNRLKELWPSVKAVADLRAKCGATFGDSVADACEKLSIAAQGLRFYMEEDVEIKRAGDAVRQWGDQEHVRNVRGNVLVQKGSKDKLSTEFEGALKALLDLLKPHR
jgi:hypothetical protein